MEIRRTLLMAAIAIVAYFMFVTWQHDFAPEKTTAAVAQSTASTTSDNTVPQLATANPQPQVTSQSTAGKLIQVHTDVMNVVIDTRGGDIVSLDLTQYPLHAETPDKPFPLLAHTQQLTFEAQSGLIGPNGTDGATRPLYQSDKSDYQLADQADSLVVTLALPTQQGVSISKRYTFTRGSYQVKVENVVDNQSTKPWQGAFYGQLKRDGSEDPSISGKGFSTMSTFLGGAYYSAENKYEKLNFDSFKGEPLKLERKGGWIALSQHYFLTAWIGDAKQNNSYSSFYKGGDAANPYYFLRYISPVQTAAPGETIRFDASLYAGPKQQDKLDAVSPGLGMTIDYGWSWFIAEPIFAVLVFLESGRFNLFGHHLNLGTGVGNWGLAIILLTLIIKLLFFRLSAASYRSMAKMRKVAPEMQRIKEQYKDDRQKQSAEMMKLYQKEKINPIGGCLPMVVQAPVFIALYYVLLYAVDLRQAPFYGWITDLSVMDPWFILPLLMGASMFIQMQLNPTPADNTQAKVMKWMPVAFTVFFLWFPAGLVLYYVTNNILSIAQQYWITRKIENG